MALIEKVIWSAPPDLPGVEILSAENSQHPWRHYHETYSIFNVNPATGTAAALSATAEWIYRCRSHCATPGSVNLIEPGELHRNTKTPPPNPFSVVLIDPKLVNDIAAEAGLRPYPHFREAVVTDPRLYRAFVRFHAALAEQTTLLQRQSLLVECVGALLQGYCEQTPRPVPHLGRRRLAWARDFLEQHFFEKITLAQLAEISGLSRYHFQRAFAQEFGLPPHRYQISLRIEKVRQWLRAGVPIHSIEAGFADQSHLIRHFKKSEGVTPARYAAMVTSRTIPEAIASDLARLDRQRQQFGGRPWR